VRLVGLHLLPSLDLVDTPRPSAVAEVDRSGTLVRLVFAASLAEVVAAVGRPPARVLVDAPLVVANETGRRDVESVLAWCDVAAFPVSRRRMAQVFGGVRGEELRRLVPPGVELAETLPDLALRLLLWEQATAGASLDLAAYRARWLGVRAPVYRPKTSGRARPPGLTAAYSILARHLDVGGWRLSDDPDDWTAIRDAAALDAIACAYVAWREATVPHSTMRVGRSESGELVLPVDSNLRGRLEVTLGRLRAEGAIAI
jgi:predicted nuclease with RNAse H fold